MAFWSDVWNHMKQQLERGEIRTSPYPTVQESESGQSQPRARFDVAHVKVQGQDMIIIVMDHSFGHLSPSHQQDIYSHLQISATDAGLAGTVVLVWNESGGGMGFRAPRPWHPFFESINMLWVERNINKTLNIW